MFTGLIKAVSKPIKIVKNSNTMELTFEAPKTWKLENGESINIDGICSTVTKVDKTFSVFYMDETLDKTALNSLDKNHQFNLERSLTLNDLMGGHLVNGHVDCIAKVKSLYTFSLPKKFSKYLIYKGSVAINGVSLTVTSVNDTSFSVALIPHTLENTNLGNLKVGDLVNIEVDMIAKYAEKLLKS